MPDESPFSPFAPNPPNADQEQASLATARQKRKAGRPKKSTATEPTLKTRRRPLAPMVVMAPIELSKIVEAIIGLSPDTAKRVGQLAHEFNNDSVLREAVRKLLA